MALQNCAPFPHMTVAKNIAFTAETSECPQDDCGPRVTIPRPVTVEALEAILIWWTAFLGLVG